MKDRIQTSVRFDKENLNYIKKKAFEQDKTRSDIVNELIEKEKSKEKENK